MDESQFSDPAEDDAYSALFRPSTPAPTGAPDEEEVIVIFEEAQFVPVAPPVVPPVISSPKADTGRLFRSVGAESVTTALPALSRSEAAHLRTVGAEDTVAMPAIAEEIEPEPADAPAAPATGVIHTSEAMFASPITSEPEQVKAPHRVSM